MNPLPFISSQHANTSPNTLATFSFTGPLDSQQMSLHSRHTMLALSYLIEDYAGYTDNTYLIATFQRFSLYQRQYERYQRLARHCPQIYVLGIPDKPPPTLPNVTMLPLETSWPLIHEWVVIASGPTCCVGLFACDRERVTPARRSRHFHALWTTNTSIIDERVAAFYAALGLPVPTIVRDNYATHHTTMALQKELPSRLRQI